MNKPNSFSSSNTVGAPFVAPSVPSARVGSLNATLCDDTDIPSSGVSNWTMDSFFFDKATPVYHQDFIVSKVIDVLPTSSVESYQAVFDLMLPLEGGEIPSAVLNYVDAVNNKMADADMFKFMPHGPEYELLNDNSGPIRSLGVRPSSAMVLRFPKLSVTSAVSGYALLRLLFPATPIMGSLTQVDRGYPVAMSIFCSRTNSSNPAFTYYGQFALPNNVADDSGLNKAVGLSTQCLIADLGSSYDFLTLGYDDNYGSTVKFFNTGSTIPTPRQNFFNLPFSAYRV